MVPAPLGNPLPSGPVLEPEPTQAMNMPSLNLRGASRARSLIPASACAVAAALAACLTPASVLAQQPTVTGYGPGNPPPPVNFGGAQVSDYNNRGDRRPGVVQRDNRDVHVVVTDPHAGPRFYYGPNHAEFHFVRPLPERHIITTRESFLDLLLHPIANAVAWSIGDVVSADLANALGVPVNSTVYAVAPGTPIVSTLPPGYFVAEAVPANVALVTQGPAGAMVIYRNVPPGAFVAYQTSVTGSILNEVIVVPPVQQVVVQQVNPAPTVIVAPPAATTPSVVTAPATPAEPAAAEGSSSLPLSSKIGKIVYDGNHQPIGVIVLDSDGQQEFVPLTQTGDAKPADAK